MKMTLIDADMIIREENRLVTNYVTCIVKCVN